MVELVFATKRLYARRWNAMMDAESTLAIYGDEDVVEYLSALPQVKDLSEAIDFMQKRIEAYDAMNDGSACWAVELQDTQEIVGSVMLKRLPDAAGKATEDMEVGWHFRRDAWGKGYATEAASGAISFAFRELNLREINAVMDPDNTRSIRVAQRLGMHEIGLTKEYYGVECLHYRLHQEDWDMRF